MAEDAGSPALLPKQRSTRSSAGDVRSVAGSSGYAEPSRQKSSSSLSMGAAADEWSGAASILGNNSISESSLGDVAPSSEPYVRGLLCQLIAVSR